MLNQELTLAQFPLFSVEDEMVQAQETPARLKSTQPAKPLSKKEYQKIYYRINKEKIREKKKTRDQFSLFQFLSNAISKIQLTKINWRKISKWFEISILVSLSILMTLYLVREAAAFYIEGNEGAIFAYLKAAMVEGTAILFSFSRGKGSILRWAQKVVMVLLCGLTLWTMSGKVVRSAVHDTSKFRIITQSIRDLETELKQKEHLRDKLMKHDWIGATRRSDKELVNLRQRLGDMRQTLGETQSPHVVINSVGILIAFRLLIVAANLICIHLMMEQIGFETQRKNPKLAVV